MGITPSVLGLLTERVLDLPSLRSGTGGCRRENETRGTQVCAMRKGAWGRMIDQSFGSPPVVSPQLRGERPAMIRSLSPLDATRVRQSHEVMEGGSPMRASQISPTDP